MAGPQAVAQNTMRGINPPGLLVFVLSFFGIFLFSFIIDFIHAVTAKYSYPTLQNTGLIILGIGSTGYYDGYEVNLTAHQRKGNAAYSHDYPGWAAFFATISAISYWGLLVYAICIMVKVGGCNCGDDCCGNSKGSWVTWCCNCCAAPNGYLYVSVVGLHAFSFLLSSIGMLVSAGYYEPHTVIEYSAAFGFILAIITVLLWIGHLGWTVKVFIPASEKHWQETGTEEVIGQQINVGMVAAGQVLGAPVVAGPAANIGNMLSTITYTPNANKASTVAQPEAAVAQPVAGPVETAATPSAPVEVADVKPQIEDAPGTEIVKTSD